VAKRRATLGRARRSRRIPQRVWPVRRDAMAENTPTCVALCYDRSLEWRTKPSDAVRENPERSGPGSVE
jgi:hypothetical protein